MPKEYIEREALIEELKKVEIGFRHCGVGIAPALASGVKGAIDKIKSFPTADVVEVTHCENCNCFELMTSNNQHFCNQFGGYVTENDYCSRPSPKKRKDK